jgi:valyl-tRNA synthetase
VPTTDDSAAGALPKSWEPGALESEIYQGWLDAGYFTADPTSAKPPYSIVLPPPNVTGSLHMGHALDHTLMDALTRRKRMQGFEVLWLPGMDHAGIATQTLVEKRLAAEGSSREDLGRERFIDEVWEWKHESGGTIGAQMRRLGDGVDWSRDRFTMDEGLSRAVRTIFKRLFDAGLIYRAERLVNWSPVLQTAISDLEVKYEEVEGELVSFRYGSLDDAEPHIVVATTRIETMLGDTAIAVHPDDDRYRHLIGRTLPHPFQDREIVVVADTHVDPEFGTGAVKVTPAHDPNDFEIGLRHNLAMPSIMDTRGNRNAVRRYGPFRGPGQGPGGAGRAGPGGRREAPVSAQRGALRAQRRAHRAAAEPAVVGPGRNPGQGRRRRGSRR